AGTRHFRAVEFFLLSNETKFPAALALRDLARVQQKIPRTLADPALARSHRSAVFLSAAAKAVRDGPRKRKSAAAQAKRTQTNSPSSHERGPLRARRRSPSRLSRNARARGEIPVLEVAWQSSSLLQFNTPRREREQASVCIAKRKERSKLQSAPSK